MASPANPTLLPAPPRRLALAPPRFIVAWSPRWQDFTENWKAAWGKPDALTLHAPQGVFWPDVFVHRPLAKQKLLFSYVLHAFVLSLLYFVPSMVDLIAPDQPALSASHDTTVTYYKLSPYLPELHAGASSAKVPRTGEPKLAAQPISSLPERADNLEQTILDPSQPNILNHHVEVPNLVINTPVLTPAPIASDANHVAKLSLPSDVMVVAPAVHPAETKLDQRKSLDLPSPAAIAPPAEITDAKLKLRDLQIADTTPQVAAPKLEVQAARALPSQTKEDGKDAAEPSLPSAASGGSSQQAIGQLIALGVNPSLPKGPVTLPGGSRHGEFAAGPEGNAAATGTPEIKSGAGDGHGSGGNASGSSGNGTGADKIDIGGSPVPTAGPAVVASAGMMTPPAKAGVSPDLRSILKAAASRPTVGEIARTTRPDTETSGPEGTLEKQVFGGRRFYSMTLNMPNLTSAGGSWVVRFAELRESRDKSVVSAPVALNKVDPAYPADAVRDHTEGVVTVYAVIRADGSVTDVRVLQGIDARLDESARTAMSKWHFQPATKNGEAVDLEAVVQIPFKLKHSSWQ